MAPKLIDPERALLCWVVIFWFLLKWRRGDFAKRSAIVFDPKIGTDDVLFSFLAVGENKLEEKSPELLGGSELRRRILEAGVLLS